jgi:hypothetical protein
VGREHGEDAERHMLARILPLEAAPGFSNHSNVRRIASVTLESTLLDDQVELTVLFRQLEPFERKVETRPSDAHPVVATEERAVRPAQ